MLQWVNRYFTSLRLSPAVAGARISPVADNPKRRQRQAAKAVDAGIGTRSMQALQLAREQSKTERAAVSKEARDAEAERRFLLSQEKKKARHRGH